MSTLQLPKLAEHHTSALYFQELFELNKKLDPKFSHRSFAQILEWPVSYVADLIKGRKQLTVNRALEFAQFSNLNILDFEKFIYLALAEHPTEQVRDCFKEKLAKRFRKNPDIYNQTTVPQKELFEEIEIAAIFEVLKWARKRLPSDEIKKLLFTFPRLTTERIDEIVHLLAQKNIIEIQNGEMKILKTQMILDEFNTADNGIRINGEYGKNFVRYTENPIFPALYTSGFLEIPKGQFNEVARKLLEMRNWLLQYSLENNLKEKTSLGSSFVYQFDINLVLMIDKMFSETLDRQKDA